jgi:hypothetical protein
MWLRIANHKVIKQLVLNSKPAFHFLGRLMKSIAWSMRTPPVTQNSVPQAGIITDNNSILCNIKENCITKCVPQDFQPIDPALVTGFNKLCKLLHLNPNHVYKLSLPAVAKRFIEEQATAKTILVRESSDAHSTLITLRASHLWMLCLHLKLYVQNPNLRVVTLDCIIGLEAGKASFLQISVMAFDRDPEHHYIIYIRRQ